MKISMAIFFSWWKDELYWTERIIPVKLKVSPAGCLCAVRYKLELVLLSIWQIKIALDTSWALFRERKKTDKLLIMWK